MYCCCCLSLLPQLPAALTQPVESTLADPVFSLLTDAARCLAGLVGLGAVVADSRGRAEQEVVLVVLEAVVLVVVVGVARVIHYLFVVVVLVAGDILYLSALNNCV